MRLAAIWALVLFSRGLAAAPSETPVEPVQDAPPLAPVQTPEEMPRPHLFGSLNDQQLLLVGLRLDAGYNAGNTIIQGFSIPSVRLSAWGHVGDWLGYRFSLGQTREFSSVLLPQVMPVEAYMDFNSASAMDWDPRARITLRMGLFTPTVNPWWSPDLADIPLPDFHETHRALFLSRDMGAELGFEPIAKKLIFTVGVFNGTGIFTLNTNNSKAFTASVRGNVEWTTGRFSLGAGALLHEQAEPSSVNFKSNAVGNAYALLEFPGIGFRLTGEVFAGDLNDSTRSARPVGAAGTFQIGILRGVRFFTRAEILTNTGIGNGFLRHAELGPVLDFHKSVQAYVFYQYLDTGGSIENVGWVRVRLNL